MALTAHFAVLVSSPALPGLFLLRRRRKHHSSPSILLTQQERLLLTCWVQDVIEETSRLVALGEEESNQGVLMKEVWTTLCSLTKPVRPVLEHLRREWLSKRPAQKHWYMDYSTRRIVPVLPHFDHDRSHRQQNLTTMKEM